MKIKLGQPEHSDPAFECVRPSKVPKVLQTGALFQSLDKEDDTPIQVPVGTSKANLNVRSTNQLSLLLNSLRFWGVNAIPDHVLALLINRSVPLTAAVVDNFKVCFPILEPMHKIIHQLRDPESADQAIIEDSVEVLEFYRRRGFKFCFYHAKLAARKGSKKSLAWLHRSGIPLSLALFKRATESNSLRTIRYLYRAGCPCDSEVLELVAFSDNVECLKYALKHDFPRGTDNTLLARSVVYNENTFRFEKLVCLHQHGFILDGVLHASAHSGEIACMQYAYENGDQWSADVVYEAAAQGQHVCMNFAIEHGCPYDPVTLAKFR